MEPILLYAMRHGVTDMNDGGVIQGKLPSRLTDEGRAQALGHARKIRGEGPGPWRVIASPVLRTTQTAEIVATELGAAVELCEGLTEIGRGSLEGREKALLQGAELEIYRAFRDDPWNVRLPGPCSESLADVEARVRRDALPRIRELAGGPGTLVVVSHGSVVKILVMLVCSYDRTMVLQVPSAHGFLHRVRRRGQGAELELLDGSAGHAEVDWRALPPRGGGL